MLTVAAPFDPVFPTLDAALDPDLAGAAFLHALARQGRVISGLRCTIERSRIKRGRKALIGYRLNDGAGIDQRVMLTLYPDRDPARLAKVDACLPLGPSQLGPDCLPIPDLAGQAWFFPNDRKVGGIARLLDEREGVIEIVHYVPEQGCTVRLRQGDGSVLYGKCRADDRGAVAARFGAEGLPGNPALRLARIVAHDAANRIVWQAALAGEPLRPSAILSEPALWADRISRAISALHDLNVPAGLKHLTFASAAKTILRRLELTRKSMPELSTRLAAFALDLARSLPEETAAAPSHGDLHPGNLLWDGNSFGLIDLDTAALAPRAFDHATLTAALVHKAIEHEASDEAIAAMVEAFRRGAEADRVAASAFHWSLAASLVGERLYRCTTRLKSPSQALRERLLQQAETWVNRNA